MTIRALGWFLVGVCALAACGKDSKGGPSVADLEKRCDALSKACADTDKHVEKLGGECKAAAKTESERGCGDKAIALYNCYENAVCGTGDRVWALPDLKVLAERHKKCDAEQAALTACVDKK
ncbi:MAG TPA: hypothetical protein VMZ53_16390 [Kofleriaceae bacterium]|nr:hypothetical protein [Kofleriaceae bacterium]